MRNLFVALAVIGLFGLPPKAFGQNELRQPSDVQTRIRATEEEARANALLTSLLETYRQLLEREQGITADEQRQIATAIDQGRLAIPKLATVVREIYSRFRGDRVLVGASFGLGGEMTFFRNKTVPLINRVPFVKQLATGGDASVGIAGVLLHNELDGTFLPQFSGYYSVGLNEAQVTPIPNPGPGRPKVLKPGAGSTQGYVVWKIYLVPRNLLTAIGAVPQSSDPDKMPAHVGALTGTYLGGGAEAAYRLGGATSTLQTQVFGRWAMPTRTEAILPQLAPEVIMISLAPTIGFSGPRFSTQGGAQYLGFFGIHQL